MALDPETEERIEQPVSAEAERETRLTPAEGATALYDAVYLGLSKVKAGQHPKKALLLITDGEDNHSRYSRAAIADYSSLFP